MWNVHNTLCSYHCLAFLLPCTIHTSTSVNCRGKITKRDNTCTNTRPVTCANTSRIVRVSLSTEVLQKQAKFMNTKMRNNCNVITKRYDPIINVKEHIINCQAVRQQYQRCTGQTDRLHNINTYLLYTWSYEGRSNTSYSKLTLSCGPLTFNSTVKIKLCFNISYEFFYCQTRKIRLKVD